MTAPDPAGRAFSTKLMTCAAAVLVLAVGLFGGNDTSSDDPRPARAAPAATQPPPERQTGQEAGREAVQPVGKHLPRARPVRLLIPKISVDAPFTDLSVGPKGQLEAPPPDDINLVGWHSEGASPGEPGTSVIAGHVDTKTSAAVFAGLSALKKGDVFHVDRADGRRASFVVDSVETFDKGNFPDRRVYADTPQAQARLITCAGDYDRTVMDYTDNLVVFAHLT